MRRSVQVSARSSLLALCLATMTLALCGCVPLDVPVPPPENSSTAQSGESSAALEEWANCVDPVITSGDQRSTGWKIITAIEMRQETDQQLSTELFNDPFNVSINWEGEGPGTEKFTEAIGENTGYSALGSIDGVDTLTQTLRDIDIKTPTVGFQAVDRISVPITLQCGEQSAKGTLNTWRNTQTGFMDCSLPAQEPTDSAASTARKIYCITD